LSFISKPEETEHNQRKKQKPFISRTEKSKKGEQWAQRGERGKQSSENNSHQRCHLLRHLQKQVRPILLSLSVFKNAFEQCEGNLITFALLMHA
jgi:predicted GTPase